MLSCDPVTDDVIGLVQPSRQLSASGRWVASPTQQGSSLNPFARPSKTLVSSPLASQGFTNQPYKPSPSGPSHGPGPITGPITASWDATVPNGQAQHPQSLPGTSSAPVPTFNSGGQGRWSNFTGMFRPGRNKPQQHRLGSGALLDHSDAMLSSIAEADPEAGVVDASLHAYKSTDLDAASAASSANRLWAITSPSLSPRRNAAASQASDSRTDTQTGAFSQGNYPVPSPWSTPTKPAPSSSPSPSPGSYPVPSPQTAPLGHRQSRRASPAASVGPFEAAARARAAPSQAGSSSPADSITASPQQANPSPAPYPVPSPSNSQQLLDPAAPSRSASSRASLRASPVSSVSNRPGYPVPFPVSDWSTGISGMSTTKAARSSNAGARQRKL